MTVQSGEALRFPISHNAARIWFAVAAAFAPLSVGFAETAGDYPVIARLDPTDVLFRQLEDSIGQSLAAEQTGGRYPDLTLFRYVVQQDTDIFSIAARLNLPYETLATINRFGNSRLLKRGETIVLPSISGIFLADDPANDLEFLMDSWRRSDAECAMPVMVVLGGRMTAYRLFPGTRFHAAERAFFLNVQFRFPLPKGRMTSGFGFRASPLSGKAEMHSGIDLAASEGIDVYAARSGFVSFAGFDAVYGNYVIVEHEGGWETVYGHLSAILVRLKESVKSGMILGKVGSTGASTGPHLHFEVRLRGAPRDPATVLPRFKP